MLAFDIAHTEIRNRKGLPTMKLTIDVEVCSFAKPRGSTGSIRYFRDPVTVEVKEVSDNDAPVAMRWTSRFDGPLETRWYDGSHWFAFDGVPHSVDERTFSASDIARMTMDPRDRRMAYVYSGYFRKGDTSFPYIDRQKFVQFDDNGRQRVHETVREWASDALVVGDTFYTRCPEPRYRACSHGPEVIIERAIAGGEARRFDRVSTLFSSGLVFRADRFEQATTASRDAWPSESGDGERIEVLIDDSLTVEDDRDALLDICMDTLRESAKQEVMRLPPPVIGALSPIATCFWQKQREEVDGEEVYHALVGFVDAVVATNYDLRSLSPAADYAIRTVLSRWDDRPITLSATPDFRNAPK